MKPIFSPNTADLLQRLEMVTLALEDPENTMTEAELMAMHVRSAVSPEGVPYFTPDVLKLAAVELLRRHQPG